MYLGAKMELRDLYREYDKLWDEFGNVSIEERRSAFESSFKDGSKATKLHHKLRTKGEEIHKHDDYADFEGDLRDILGRKIRQSDFAGPRLMGKPYESGGGNIATDAYGALCNVTWEHEKGTRYSCSWRHAGSVIASIRGEGDYLDWYCSGNEGHVTKDIETAMKAKGWIPTNLG